MDLTPNRSHLYKISHQTIHLNPQTQDSYLEYLLSYSVIHIMHSHIFISLVVSVVLGVGVNAQNGSGSHGPPSDANPLTYGWYATPEIQNPTQLEVVGTIPQWVRGSLYRGAAATWDTGNFTAEHWFDGFSRNHRFEIQNGQVEYRSRNASDEQADFVKETGLFPGGSFGSDPCKIVFGAFEATFRDGTNQHGNTSSGNVPVSWVGNLLIVVGLDFNEAQLFY